MAPKKQTKAKKATSPKGTRKVKTLDERRAEALRTHTYVHVRQAKDKAGVPLTGTDGKPKLKYSEVQITGYKKFWEAPKARSPRLGPAKRPSLYDADFIYLPEYRIAGNRAFIRATVFPSVDSVRQYNINSQNDPNFNAEILALEDARANKLIPGTTKKPLMSLDEIIALGNHVLTVGGEHKKAATPRGRSLINLLAQQQLLEFPKHSLK